MRSLEEAVFSGCTCFASVACRMRLPCELASCLNFMAMGPLCDHKVAMRARIGHCCGVT